MNHIDPFSLVSGLVSLVTIIVFIALASNVSSIKRILTNTVFNCKNCKFQTSVRQDFCPVCGIGATGKTLDEMKAEFKK